MLLHALACTPPPPPAASAEPELQAVSLRPVVDASTMRGKLMMGYQGWFHTPDDGARRGWVHWSPGVTPAASNISFDAWPDLSEYGEDELTDTEFRYADGRVAGLYSAQNATTVGRHVSWMQQYGIDGVLLQRFTCELSDPTAREARDRVIENIRDASEQYGRVFALEYDISGADPATIASLLIEDWEHLVDDLGITESDRYLRHDGRPLVTVWGFGFTDRNGTPEDAAQVINYFHNPPDARYGATVMGGVPGEWRSLGGDSKSDPRWADVYRSYDVINPWAVGRFADASGADAYRRAYLEPDLAAARAAGREYMPVVFPGFSWANLFDGQPLNQIPRDGGRFYWRQVYNAVDAGAPMIFNAMFDEVDEGTAMFKIAAKRGDAPENGTFLTLDADGESLPSDWYLRVAGEATSMLAGEKALTATLPISPDDPTPETPPPAGWNELVVTRAYRGILGREPDEGGLASWVANMDAGLDEYDVAEAFWTSGEFVNDRAPLGAARLAADLYTGILGREGDPEGLDATREAIERGEGALRAGDMLVSEEAGG